MVGRGEIDVDDNRHRPASHVALAKPVSASIQASFPACCNASALRETQNRRRFLMEPTIIRGMSGNQTKGGLPMRTAIILTAILGSCGFCLSANAQQADMTFFITSAGPGKGGDLGGLAGADAHCQSLAQAAGAGNKTWRAYLSTNARGGANAVHARDRIGNGPWQNAKGAVIATSVADLHSDNNKISKANALDEKGQPIKVRGDTPNMHDILTGSDKDGHAFPSNMDLTCRNWTSSDSGVAMLGHADRQGNPPVAGSQNVAAYMETARSWNAAHTSRGCAQPDLIATGGNGLFYCFAAQ
jgi:hypothetical protein